MCSIISEKPGPEVTVKAFAPPHTPPCNAIDAASSSSIWMKQPPTVGTRCAKRSTTSVEGVIGYPAAKRAPAASAPSQQAWSPSIKCVPVSTPRGSAFIFHLRFGRLGLIAVDGKVRTVHAAQIAAAALIWRHHMRRMIAFGIKCRGKREHLGGTELHAEPACLTSLDNDGDASFCHEYPHEQGRGRPGSSVEIMNFPYRRTV